MAFVSVKITGLNELKASLKNQSPKLEKSIDQVLGINTREMERNAKRDAPADQGLLRAEITTKRVKSLSWVLTSGANYSGYVEFGTKSKVQIPAGLEDVAAQVRAEKFTGTLEAKEAIFNWCKRNGIEQRLWYPIYLSIMIKGRKAHPFFFKQGDRQAKAIEQDIKQVVQREQRL